MTILGNRFVTFLTKVSLISTPTERKSQNKTKTLSLLPHTIVDEHLMNLSGIFSSEVPVL